MEREMPVKHAMMETKTMVMAAVPNAKQNQAMIAPQTVDQPILNTATNIIQEITSSILQMKSVTMAIKIAGMDAVLQ